MTMLHILTMECLLCSTDLHKQLHQSRDQPVRLLGVKGAGARTQQRRVHNDVPAANNNSRRITQVMKWAQTPTSCTKRTRQQGACRGGQQT
jgi:hypothetical protein